MKRIQRGKKTNFWKWAFLLLLAFQLAAVAFIWLRVTTRREPVRQSQDSAAKQVQIGTFSTSREQLNDTVAAYLKDYQTDRFSYKVYAAESQILFEGSYTVMGSEVPLYIYLPPSRDKNGAVLLEVLDISAGTLSLPTSDVLSYIAKNYKLPQGIQIDVKQARIVLDLPNMFKKEGLVIQAQTIDLYGNQLIFDIFRKNH